MESDGRPLDQEGKIRAIGVSNFLPHHLDALLETAPSFLRSIKVRLAPGVYQDQVVAIVVKQYKTDTKHTGLWIRRIVYCLLSPRNSKSRKTVAWDSLGLELANEGFYHLKSVTTSRIQVSIYCLELNWHEWEKP